MKALGEWSSDECGFHMHTCVPPAPSAEQLRENKGQSNTWDHFSMERTSVVMVWLVPLSRSQITVGQAPASPSWEQLFQLMLHRQKPLKHTHILERQREGQTGKQRPVLAGRVGTSAAAHGLKAFTLGVSHRTGPRPGVHGALRALGLERLTAWAHT